MLKRCAALLAGLAALALLACQDAPPSVSEISASQLLEERPSQALVLDVRTPGEFASGHVPGAQNISHDQLAARVNELDASKNDPVIVYCERGGRAGQAASVLQGAGFRDIRHLTGDMSQWREQGLPMEAGPPAS